MSATAPLDRSIQLPLRWGRALSRHLDEHNAVPIATIVAVGFGWADHVTGADITVNFLYQIPIFIACWFRRWTGASVVITVCVAARLAGMLHASTPRLGSLNIAWNTLAEAVAFVIFAFFVIELRARVQETRTQLVSTTEQLRHAERLSTLGKLAAGVAHELGTPLNVLMVRAELIRSHEAKGEQIIASAESILKQADRISVIIRQLLHFGRRGATSRARTDLRIVARDAAQLVAPAAKSRQIGVAVDEPSDAVWAEVNIGEMEQVVANLLMNAIQASPKGASVRVAVGSRIDAGPDGKPAKVAYLAVKDQGSGIAPADLPHIFDPFFTTKDIGEGTGLGLAVSFGIVGDHGGRIDVESRLDAGSELSVVLPV